MKNTKHFIIFGITILVFVLVACLATYLLGRANGSDRMVDLEVEMTMNLTSSSFGYGEAIPVQYSCKGADVSPALAWDEPPASTQSFALIMDDPDAPAGTWDHWVLFNIPAETRSLAENFQPAELMIVGRNSWGKSVYGGPCPPSGTHRYFFRLYALDTTLVLSNNADKQAVLDAMQGHVLAKGELMGTFSK